MTCDLSTYRPGDWLRLRCGALHPGPLGMNPYYTVTMDPYYKRLEPFMLGDRCYTLNGAYYVSGRKELDIVEVVPAAKMTFILWITDRRPTEEDATDGSVLVKYAENDIQLWRWNVASRRQEPWARCPGWTPPEPVNDCPEPDPKDMQIAELQRKVESMAEQLNELWTWRNGSHRVSCGEVEG